MAVYNGARYLQESIDSVLAQTVCDFEFVIVNDGSEDNTTGLLNHYEQSDTRIRIHPQEHSGLVVSLNTGCRLARGKYIARMDADDIAFPDRLQRQIDFLEGHPDIALLGGAYVLINGNGIASIILRKPPGESQIRAMMGRGHNPFLHSTIVMRKDALHSLGGYRSRFLHAEDYDLWLRFAERFRVANLLEPVIYYRVHPEQVSHHNLEQGILSVLASQASARIRAETGAEPRWQMERVTSDVLHDLGVQDRVIQKALTEGYFWQANMMLLSGNGDGGLVLLPEALSHSRAGFMRRKVGQWLRRAHAKLHRNQPRLGRRIVLDGLLLLNACCIQVSLARELLWFKVCRVWQFVWRYRFETAVSEGFKRKPLTGPGLRV